MTRGDPLKLDRAPIIEAVVDIDCDTPIGQSLESLRESAKRAFESTYPVFRERIVHAHTFAAAPEAGALVGSERALGALQFFSHDEKQLVQVRAGGFSFNRLAPYGSFDEYLPEIRRAWDRYRALVTPSQVRKLGLRYINRIILPGHKEIELDEYFRVAPRTPDDSGFVLTGFIQQQTATERGTGNQVRTVLAGQPPVSEGTPVIFDNTVQADFVREPLDWQSIELKLLDLRRLKNEVFRLTLTETCLNLFRDSSASA